ncbi:hypothetical protein F4778DRAFT_368101 [Xylariomycetidae sp. FL2044]|nr:hypothetical protein F4778DRAFT_368101 [Xylariomycetidae sp. FL2044]
MCGKYYRQYRCGHTRRATPDYCDEATFNRRTGRWSLCRNGHTTVAVHDPSLCGKPQCYLRDLRLNGYTCCKCGQTNNRTPLCIGPPGGQMECPHEVCKRCTYTPQDIYTPQD